MGSFSDIFKILGNVPLWNQLKILPGKVNDIESRLKRLESQKLSDNKKLHCKSCGYAPVDIKTTRRNDNSRKIVRDCINCGDKSTEYPDDPQPPKGGYHIKNKHI